MCCKYTMLYNFSPLPLPFLKSLSAGFDSSTLVLCIFEWCTWSIHCPLSTPFIGTGEKLSCKWKILDYPYSWHLFTKTGNLSGPGAISSACCCSRRFQFTFWGTGSLGRGGKGTLTAPAPIYALAALYNCQTPLSREAQSFSVVSSGFSAVHSRRTIWRGGGTWGEGRY